VARFIAWTESANLALDKTSLNATGFLIMPLTLNCSFKTANAANTRGKIVAT
jgi:hypothetical protein